MNDIATIMSGLIMITALITGMMVVIYALMNGINGIVLASYLVIVSNLITAGLVHKIKRK